MIPSEAVHKLQADAAVHSELKLPTVPIHRGLIIFGATSSRPSRVGRPSPIEEFRAGLRPGVEGDEVRPRHDPSRSQEGDGPTRSWR